MSKQRSRRLSARWVLPVTSDPIKNGWIRIERGRIAEVGSGDPGRDAEDLGDVAVLPGLINAHTHLEFSTCGEPVGRAGMPLDQWIRRVIAARRDTSVEAKQQAVEVGMQELSRSGTLLAGEITTPPCHYSTQKMRPELVAFAEVLGLARQRWDERLESAVRHNATFPNAGWSPHAPYSTSLDCIERCIELAHQSDRPLAMHVAESPAERELLTASAGPLAQMLRDLGVWQDQTFPWGADPFGMLIDRLAQAPSVLLIHGNDLSAVEMDRLRPHRHITVVYCPRTHAYFGYGKHPVGQMLEAGVRVALGTDSRASNPDLNVWHEVQFLLRHRSDLSPRDVLAMATRHGADAFRRRDLGRIEVGCCGELGTVATSAGTTDELYADLSRNCYSALEDTQPSTGIQSHL